ncbi:T6SS effector BTH_I2691 family protein [uncultured Psychrobacter sp.]|uniref:T6SS effector BTH_I2691 family protein n=1 Tax=uncultured Psychrobacter sp. TaxID=259303 RepID=UPI0025917510|nr:T6SS effector BTH_I2691 family protein [uncultured Psychrobacter sp.]
MAEHNRCEQCLAEGITLLLTRWGCTFEDNVEIYGRLLREGYVYIIDNNRECYGYVVTQNRYLKQFDVKNVEKTPGLPIVDYTCHRGDNCTALNSFIRIPNPNKDIDTLWVAYSPVKWTKAVIEKHQNNTDGAKTNNMIEVPVSATQSKSETSLGVDSQNAGKYELWEYDPEEDGKKEDFQHFPIEYLGYVNPFTKKPYDLDKSNEKDKLKIELSKIENSGNRVLNVYFNDEIGKLIDLNEFMIQAQLAYRPSEIEVHNYTVATLISTLRNNIDEKAKADAQRHIDRVNEHTKLMQPMPRWEEDGPSEAEQQAEEQRRQEGASRYFERQRQSAWSSYSNLIRESEMNSWLANFEAISKQRQDELYEVLLKLSSYYYVVFEGERLKNIMTNCFDKNDETSCVYYTLTVQQFLGSTATMPMLTELYDLHLSQKAASDDDNYLARALAFNQDQVLNHIEGLPAITAGFTTSEIATNSWSGLLYTGSAAIFGRYDAIADQVGITIGLAEQLAVPFMNNYRTGQTLSGLMLSQKEYLFGYHHEKALIIVKGQGSYADARKALINGIMHIAGDGSLPTKIRESVDQALKTSGESARLNKTISQNFIYYIDKNQLRAGMNVYQNSSKVYSDKNTLRQVIDQSVNTTSGLYDQSYKDYKRFADITNRRIDLAVRTHYFGAMLQTVACVFLVSAFFQAKTQEDRLVEGSKAAAGLMVLLGGSLEMRGNASKLLASELELAKGAGQSVNAKKLSDATRQAGRLSIVARGLGIGGAGIFAGFDVKSAIDAKGNDNEVMMWAYAGSAATGAGSTLLLTLSASTAATGIGIVLLVGFIGVTLFIGYWRKTGMENWLELGIWGVKNEGWSLEHTLEQFDRAVVGEDIDQKDN